MVEYMTRKEATELLGKSITYLDNRIASGEISTILDPKKPRKRLLLASDVYRIKAEERAEARLEAEKKRKEDHDFYSLLRMADKAYR